MTKSPRYRDPSFNPKTIRSILCIPDNILRPTMVLCADGYYNGEDAYRDWIKDWKTTYTIVSALIKEMKQGIPTSREQHIALDSLRRLANTLINARQHIRDQRKSHFTNK